MAKIIGIKTKNEIAFLPFNESDAAKVMIAILELNLDNPTMVSQILGYLSNNSGLSSHEVAFALVQKKLSNGGK